MKKLGYFIAKFRVMTLLVATGLLVPAMIGYLNTGINYDLLDYLPDDLDSTMGAVILDEEFHNAATSMLAVSGLSEKELVDMKEEISEVPGVSKVLWRDDVADITVPVSMLPDKLLDNFYNDDRTEYLMMVKFENSSSSSTTMEAIEQIREISGEHGYLGGMSTIVKDTNDIIDKEMPFYILIAVTLMIVVLAMTNTSTIVPFMFIANIGYAIVYNMGTNIFLGQISYVTKALAAILQLAVSMDYSIFLYHRYEEEREVEEDHTIAMGNAIAKTASSIAGSSLTTIAGFLALIAMRIKLGSDLGIVMAKGVAFGLITCVTILPALMLVFDGPIHKYSHKTLLPKFEKLSDFVVKHHIALVIVFIIAYIPAIYGAKRTPLYYNMDRALPQDSPSVVALNKLKDDFDMQATNFAILRDDLPTWQYQSISNEIKKLNGVEAVISSDDFIGPMVPSSFLPSELTDNFDKAGYKAVMIQSSLKAATPESTEQLNGIKKIVKARDKSGIVTGESALTEDLSYMTTADFNSVSAASNIIVGIIVALVFKSIAIPILLLITIQLAIQINMGIPYFTGNEIPFIASIIVGTIQLGSTIDYSILLTSRYVEELQVEPDKYVAMKTSMVETARSIVTSGLAFLAATAGVGLYSKMGMVGSICILLARGALISMVVILVLMPPLLLFFDKFLRITTLDLRKTVKGEIKVEQ